MPDQAKFFYWKQSTIQLFVPTSALTLTEAHLMDNLVTCNSATGFTVTIPAAEGKYLAGECTINNKGAGPIDVNVVAGFGGGGTGRDSRTLQRGESCRINCDGVQWYINRLPG